MLSSPGMHEGTLAYTWSICDLGSLDDLLEKYDKHNAMLPRYSKARLPWAFVWRVFWSLTNALKYIHHGIAPSDYSWTKLGSKRTINETLNRRWPKIIHRDVKPGNVFLKSTGSSLPKVQ